MRKIVNSTFMSLDGDISNMQDWHFRFTESEEFAAAARERLFASDALIMGRKTYEGFSSAWPERAGADEYSDRINSMKKLVVSSTLTAPEWTNTDVIADDVPARVAELKQQDGQNILQFGFGDVTRLLLDNGLVDEVHIWLHPVLAGKASPAEMIHRDGPQYDFKLAGTEVHGNGLILLTYTPAVAG